MKTQVEFLADFFSVTPETATQIVKQFEEIKSDGVSDLNKMVELLKDALPLRIKMDSMASMMLKCLQAYDLIPYISKKEGITDAELKMMATHIKPILPYNSKFGLSIKSFDDKAKRFYIETPNIHSNILKGEVKEEAIGLKEICRIISYHTTTDIINPMPTTANVLRYIPKPIRDRVKAFEIFYEKGLDIYNQFLKKHVYKVVLYE